MFESLIANQYCLDYLSNQISIGLISYSHIPTAIAAIFLGGFILSRTRQLSVYILFSIGVCFAVWCALDLGAWFSFLGLQVTQFTWSIIEIFDVILFFLAYYFIYSFIKGKDLPFYQKVFAAVLLLPILWWTTTGTTLQGYDLLACESIENSMVTNYVTGVEMFFILIIVIFALNMYFHTKDRQERRKIELVTLGVGLFLLTFSLTGSLADLLNYVYQWEYAYNVGLYGLFGMPIFIIFLGYLVVKFKLFNIKVFGAQALVASLITIIASEYFFVTSLTNQVLVSVTMVLAVIFGYYLIQSVKKEIEAKERVEKLAAELEQANIQQESLIRFIGHEMKGYLTTSAGVFASIVEGDFNPISDMLKSSAEMALAKVREGVRSVVEILSNANAKKGTLEYKMQSFDFGKMVLAGIAKLMPEAKEKGLVLETGIKDDGVYMVTGDVDQISEHVVRNLIDNSVKYTPTGSIHIDLSRQGDKVRLSIRDTGVGITMEDKARLFTEGGRGKNSLATNVHSTGYGLAIAKKIVDAHSGRIWAESEGQGKGSQFYVELPATK